MSTIGPSGAAERGRRNPYVFVVGSPRSGTTLLQKMLNAHPRLAVINETHFVTRALRGRSVDRDPPLTDELVERVRTYHRFPKLGLSDTDLDAAAAAGGTYGEFLSRIYDLLAERKGKPLFGDKTPEYVRHLPLLRRLFPWAKTVHIIRDGRDVALSTLEWATPGKGPGRWELWQAEPVATCALWWRWTVRSGRDAGREVASDDYLEVRYEDLVADPEEMLRQVVSFLDLPWAPEVLGYHERYVRRRGVSRQRAWMAPTPGLRDWGSTMGERDLELFEALAGDLLDELGYDRSERLPSREVAAVAAECRRWWAGEQTRRRG